MSLEQQLSDAISAQNALTQAVANKKADIDASVAAAQTAFEAWKTGATSTVAVDVLRLFQAAGYTERPDGGASLKSWDASGSLKFTDATGGHGIHAKKIKLPAGRYVVSVAGFFLATQITYVNVSQDTNAPILAGLNVVSPDGSIGYASAEIGSTTHKGLEGAVAVSAGFTLASATEVLPLIYSNGYVGKLQLVLTSAVIGRFPT